MTDDEFFMKNVLKIAETAYSFGEVPVGAAVVRGTEVFGTGYNMTEHRQSPFAHAEIVAIESAAERLGNRRLSECTMYVTLEPCLMCAGALMNAHIKRLVFGAYAEDSKIDLHELGFMVKGGVLEQECSGLLKNFFAEKRKQA